MRELSTYTFGIGFVFSFLGCSIAWAQQVQTGPQVSPALLFDHSGHLRDLPVPNRPLRSEPEPRMLLPRTKSTLAAQRQQPDPVVQSSIGTAASAPATSTNFDGIGNGLAGFTVSAAPPDPNIAVGPNHVVQVVNTDFAVYSKSGALVYGPIPINTLWQGFGGLCQADSDGDPIVRYDAIADRYVVSQFAVMNPYLECIAVSQTSDPTGAYYRYAFSYPNFNDYPKISVWPDAYYVTYNMFDASDKFLSGKVCALDRAKMLLGQAASQQCFNVNFGALLASDFSGGTLPPSGAANHILALGASNGQLAYWNFHVDWTNSGNTKLTGPSVLTTAAYTLPCNDTGATCVPQYGGNLLDSLGDRLMYPLAYRNFGDHESLVTTHSVDVSGNIGARWYELRLDGSGNASMYQQSTFAPDSNARWMGSIAMDRAGNMALGYSASSSLLHPQIRYTGRLASDPPNSMPQGESTLFSGNGSQVGQKLDRWGDYTSMAVDPSDGCTFWYTNQYIPSDGAFNWRTRIASFKFPTCGASTGSSNIPIFGTGVTSASTLASDGSVDSHYTLISSADATAPGPNTYVGNANSGWLANGPNSKWITPFASPSTNAVYGNYIYRTTFDLTGFNPATAVLTGQWATDDFGSIRLNGVAVPNSSISGYGSLTSFTISSGFIAGVNTLDFVVMNWGGPTGVRVEVSGTASTQGGSVVSVGVNPTSATLTASQTQQFTATVSGSSNTAVTWSLSPASGAGTIGSTGLYTAPASIPSTQTVSVIATSAADASKSSSATVTLNPTVNISVSVSPASASLTASQTQQFTATVSGTSNTAVTWSLSPASGVGTIGSTGLYTAPASIASTQTVSVIATSVADTSKSSSASITLNPTTTTSGKIAIFGTGVTSASSLATDGSVDSHYTLISSADATAPGPNAYVGNSAANSGWLANGPSSKWITPFPSPSTNAVYGNYIYRTTFDLTGLNPATAVLTGQWATDDLGSIRLNGVTVPNSSISGYGTLVPFTISSGFIAGVNTLDFVVMNWGGPTGVRVEVSGTSSTQGGSVVSVGVNPTSASLTASQTQQFTATVSGTSNTAVTWSLSPASGAGTIGSTGLYTAPASIASTQTVSVIATSVADASKSSSATVTLNPTTTASGKIAIFGTGVTSASSLATDGSVDSHYTLISSADATAPGPNAYVGNSAANSGWLANGPSSKWITPFPSPSTNAVYGNYIYRTTFDLTGLNPANAVLTGQWATDDLGSIRLNGVAVPNSSISGYGTLVPFTISSGFIAGVNTLDFVVMNWGGPTGVRVEVSGTASTQGGSVVSVGVSPASVSLTASQTQQFTATVSGSSNTAVTWSLSPASGAGTIGSTGLYTAPASIVSTQTVSVIATSVADTSKSSSASVTLNPTATSSGKIAIFGTGLTSASSLATDGSVDSHYTLISSADVTAPGPNAYVGTANPGWLANGPSSKWITPFTASSTNAVYGNYIYRTTFDLTGFNPATAVLTGQWATDDLGSIRLNGVDVPNSSITGYGSLIPFTIGSGFISGINTLDFVVMNWGGPTGVRIEVSGTAR